MKRILQITGKMDRAGAETMLMNLYRQLDKEKFQFDFINFSSSKGDYDEEIIKLGGRIFTIDEKNPFKRMKALKIFLKEHPEYEIIHAHTLFSNAFHLLAAKKAGVPFRIVHSHNTSNKSKSKLISLIYQPLSKRLINQYASYFIACGLEAAKFLFPYQKDVLILPNSIDVQEFIENSDKNKKYLEENYGVSNLKIVQIGRLENVKNPFFSLDLMERMKNKGIDFKFFIIGQGVLEQKIKETINEKKLKNYVHVLGVRSDIPELMAGADVLLMPSLHEGFPVVLVESQAVGLPAVIADTISSEVDLEMGLIKFRSLNDSLEEWSKSLLDAKKVRTEDQQRLRVMQEKGFDVKNNVKTLERIYKEMEL